MPLGNYLGRMKELLKKRKPSGRNFYHEASEHHNFLGSQSESAEILKDISLHIDQRVETGHYRPEQAKMIHDFVTKNSSEVLDFMSTINDIEKEHSDKKKGVEVRFSRSEVLDEFLKRKINEDSKKGK